MDWKKSIIASNSRILAKDPRVKSLELAQCYKYEKGKIESSEIVVGGKYQVTLPFNKFYAAMHTHREDVYSNDYFSAGDIGIIIKSECRIFILGYMGELLYIDTNKLPQHAKNLMKEYLKAIPKRKKYIMDVLVRIINSHARIL